MRSWMRQPKSGRLTRSPGAVPRITKIDSRTFSSYADADTPPVRLTATGKRHPLPRNSRLGAITTLRAERRAVLVDVLHDVPGLHQKGSPRGRRTRLRKLPLNEFAAAAAGDLRREIDLLDGQRPVLAERTAGVAGTPRDDLIEHVLPGDQLFLVHRRVLSFQGFRQTSDILGKRASWRQRARVRITPWRGGKGRSSVELASRHRQAVAMLRSRV